MTTDPMGLQARKREPRKDKKLSSAASNVAQAKARMMRGGKVGFIAQTRAEHGIDLKTGEPTLTAIFPREGALEPHHVDLSFLLAFPSLQPMFTDAFLSWGAALLPSTRLNSRDNLRRYFFAYLKSSWSNMLHPGEIDDELLYGFRDNLLFKSSERGKALHPGTVADALSVLRSVLGALVTGPWARAANRIVERVPCGPSGANRKNNPTEVLGLEQVLPIIEAAEKEVMAIEQRFARTPTLLAEGYARLRDPSRLTDNTRANYRDLAVCLAAVDEAYSGVVPDLAVIKARNGALGGAVECIHGMGLISSYFYPCARDLVPFALLMAIATVFNPNTLLSLNWTNIDCNKDQAGMPAIEIVGIKDRAARDMVRLLDPDATVSSKFSLKQMLECLRDITTRIRPHLASEHANH